MSTPLCPARGPLRPLEISCVAVRETVRCLQFIPWQSTPLPHFSVAGPLEVAVVVVAAVCRPLLVVSGWLGAPVERLCTGGMPKVPICVP